MDISPLTSDAYSPISRRLTDVSHVFDAAGFLFPEIRLARTRQQGYHFLPLGLRTQGFQTISLTGLNVFMVCETGSSQ